MAVNNNIVSAPISIGELAKLLGAKKYDLGTLCTHPNINKWAKYKPQSYASINPTAPNWRVGRDTKYGLQVDQSSYSLESACSLDSVENGYFIRLRGGFMYDLAMGNIGKWAYMKPTGGSASPYRLGDFTNELNRTQAGYKHDAKSPLAKPKSSQNVGFANAEVQSVYVESMGNNTLEEGQLVLNDIKIGNANEINMADMYVGLLCYTRDMSKCFWMTCVYDKQIVEGRFESRPWIRLPKTNNGASIDDGTYYCKCFFCSRELELNDRATDGAYFVGCDEEGVIIVSKAGGGGTSFIILQISSINRPPEGDPTVKGKLSIKITNGTSQTISVNSVKAYVPGDGLIEDEVTLSGRATINSGSYAIYNNANVPSFFDYDKVYFEATINNTGYSVFQQDPDWTHSYQVTNQ